MSNVEFIVLEDKNRLFSLPKTAHISQNLQGTGIHRQPARGLSEPQAPFARSLTQLKALLPLSVGLFIGSQDVATASHRAQTDPGPLQGEDYPSF